MQSGTHPVVSLAVKTTMGLGLTVTNTVAESVVVPQLSLRMTVYVVVTAGEASGFCTVLLLSPVDGIQV